MARCFIWKIVWYDQGTGEKNKYGSGSIWRASNILIAEEEATYPQLGKVILS